jgi:excisionase family DNA binding protein
MSEPAKNPFDLLVDQIRAVVREEMEAVANGNGHVELFTPEQLAERMKVPVSWVYEQSRQGNIPTHRIGRYVRFNLTGLGKSEEKK